MTSFILHVISGQAKKQKCILKKVSIIGTGMRTVTAGRWRVMSDSFNTIDDKVIDLISYFGFSSLAQSLQNMSNDALTV